MAYKKQYNRREARTTTKRCSCGGTAKLVSKKNYPHGKKSKCVKSSFFRCQKCSKIID